MKVTHIEHRLDQQLAVRNAISQAYDNLMIVGLDNITNERINTRLSSLKETWEKFSMNHDDLIISISKLNSEDEIRIQGHRYMANNLFSDTHEVYLDTLEKFNPLIDANRRSAAATETGRSVSQGDSVPSGSSAVVQHNRLPRITIPTFSGTPSEWLSFKDLFTSIVINNPSVLAVEKLQYLKTNLVGSAALLIKDTVLIADNFQKAWDLLSSFYENKRILVQTEMHSLFSLKRLTRESASELEQLYSKIGQSYRTLESLGCPVEHWDAVLVYVATRRLDSDSLRAWENELGSSKETPTWAQFSKFLLSRIFSLQSYEKSRYGKTAQQPRQAAAKVHFQGQTKGTSAKANLKCILCSGPHTINFCPQYNNKTIEQKKAIIVKHKLCYNCLFQHKISNCRVTTRCKKCGKKHHTSIHFKSASDDVEAKNSDIEDKPDYAKAYTDFIKEYEDLHHMERIPTTEIEPEHVYYLPHHGVMREHSLTTKLRVVFNGSSCTTTGVSLNQLLHVGGKLQLNLSDVLTWFRVFPFVFFTDAEKMYRQILIHQDDWNFQRILWLNHLDELIIFALITVTYGLTCAPFLALRTIEQLIEDEGHKYPLALPTMRKGKYVDDVFCGANTIEQAKLVVDQVNQLFMAGGFPLHKWVSNCPEILEAIPVDKRIELHSLQIEETTVHTLGLCWQPSTDVFRFTLNLNTSTIQTKRTVLSTIAKLFDPLGFLSPIIISAKIFLQELWCRKLGWDDPLPSPLSDQWTKFLNQLQEIPNFTFPRWLGFNTTDYIEIHGFCDASSKAIAAVIYIRSVSKEGTVTVNLVSSKTKVAPLKKMTIPRLELSGAVLLVKLMTQVLTNFERRDIPLYGWLDSSVAHTWITNHPSKWKEFVQNRVCWIQEALPQLIWKLIPGKQNPADCSTRGLTPSQLMERSEWKSGPQWLRQDPSTWPKEAVVLSCKDNLEERPIQVSVVTKSNPSKTWDLLYKYSSFTRPLRITAWCFRVCSRFKRLTYSSDLNPLSTQELQQAKYFWVKIVQQASFNDELKLIFSGINLPKSNSLARLTPKLDSNGLLRVGGRLQHSLLSEDAKHPLILPRDSTLSSLIIADAH